MEFASSARRVCTVGYALNPKKLRKSSHDRTKVDERESSGNCQSIPVQKREVEWKGGGLADILETGSCYSSRSDDDVIVNFVALDYEVPIEQQPHCDVIIHKLTEDIGNGTRESVAKLQALQDYLRAHPCTAIVDPIHFVERVVSRARTCHHLSIVERTRGDACPFVQPNHTVIESLAHKEQEVLAQLHERGLRFPLICKPVQACGTPNSHNMVIVTSAADLHLAPAPCVVQQYHDHDNVLYKVYVIDRDVMVFRRQSLPNLAVSAGDRCSGGSADSAGCVQEGGGQPRCLRSVAFDSRLSYPTASAFLCEACSSLSLRSNGCDADKAAGSNDSDIPAALLESFRASAAAIAGEFGLTLFGFDAIVPCARHTRSTSAPGALPAGNDNEGATADKESKVVVIDVNYFPSYKEVPDFPSRLRRYLASRKAGGSSHCLGEDQGRVQTEVAAAVQEGRLGGRAGAEVPAPGGTAPLKLVSAASVGGVAELVVVGEDGVLGAGLGVAVGGGGER